MLARLLLLFLVTPVVELALLIKLGEWIGFWPTIGLILFTGVTGSYLAKREGLSAWQRLNASFSRGGLPGKELMDGVIILISGALLITPGVLTDVVGFSGLIPLTRRWIRRYAFKRLKRAAENGTIRTSWGVFGMSTPPNPPEPSPEETPSEGESEWKGDNRRVPRHADDEDPSVDESER